jgi:hypothetical protein
MAIDDSMMTRFVVGPVVHFAIFEVSTVGINTSLCFSLWYDTVDMHGFIID